ncbi:Serpentine type 7TM GPCR chemoreceptor Srw [Popillia japonica]|uniref:Serpentine type 7TM GPCR chemoreceptor Srw n=1 Tax=Popillia japonica TaxID=7064 RepID=A0AAW1HG67_POPJA
MGSTAFLTASAPTNIIRSNDVFSQFSTAVSFSTSSPSWGDFLYSQNTSGNPNNDYNYVRYNQSSSPSAVNNMEYINVTNEMPINYAIPMYGYTMPFLLIITIIANTLIVVVLSKRHMRTPTNIVLIAMALCDMFTLLFPAPWLIYMYTLGNHYKPLWPISLCYIWFVMHEVSTGAWYVVMKY